MQVYFFTAGIESNELNELEGRIRSKLPGLRKVDKAQIGRRVAQMLELSSYTEGMRAQGLNPQTVVLDTGYIAADDFDKIVDPNKMVGLPAR